MNKKRRSESSFFDYNSDDIRTGQIESPDAEEKRPHNQANRKLIYIIAVAAVSVVLSVILIVTAVGRINRGMVMELEVGEIAVSLLEDGDYTGIYTASGMGAQVTVSVTAGTITGISLDAFSRIDTSRAERVFDAVLRSQSLAAAADEEGTEPTDIILLLAIENAVEGGYAQ